MPRPYNRTKPKKDITKTCQYCASVFESYSKAARFCSRSCYSADIIEQNTSLNYTCQLCGKAFREYRTHYRDDPKYCSKECFYKGAIGKKKRRKKRLKTKCVFCDNEFEYYKKPKPPKYCSRKCYLDHEKEKAAISTERRKRKCKFCGVEFVMRYPSGTSKKKGYIEGQFCSRKCHGKSWSDEALNLSESFIKYLFKRESSLNKHDVPDEIVNVVRLLTILKREMKKRGL